MPLSRDELDRFTRASVDPMPWGRIERPNENGHLTDDQQDSFRFMHFHLLHEHMDAALDELLRWIEASPFTNIV